jgi:glycopeptide antibiotics resistance protein
MKLWQWWILVVIAVSGPWYGLAHQPQWQRVTWIPFRGLEDKPRDIVANFFLFVPFGVSFARNRRGAAAVASTVCAGLALSLCVEIPQLFYRLRDPSATDVFMAMCGSAAGSVAAQAFDRRHAGGAPRRGETGERRGHK